MKVQNNTASKGQKLQKYTKKWKTEIIKDFYASNLSYKLIAKKYHIPIGTLATWINQNHSEEILKEQPDLSNKAVSPVVELTLSHLKIWKYQNQKISKENEILKKYFTFIRLQQKK